MTYIDPCERAQKLSQVISRGSARKYYRIPRPGRWYGGIATADCCGCNFDCVFCWSNKPRDNPDTMGTFYTPEQVAAKITSCAKKHRYRLVRISGNEPTMAKKHLTEVLTLIGRTEYTFILETNGSLLDESYVRDLSSFHNVHVRVSLKGTTPEEFAMLTGAEPDAFERVVGSLTILRDYNVSFNLAVMLSFSSTPNITRFKDRLKHLIPDALDGFEEEYVFLYPHVSHRLKRAGITPLVAHSPHGKPADLV
jgi:uncharacterized Fe-S cluster-containing radical SAM superfamily protein